MSLTRVPDFRNTERHQEALDRLALIVADAEGCPIASKDCDCTGENCVISILLETGR